MTVKTTTVAIATAAGFALLATPVFAKDAKPAADAEMSKPAATAATPEPKAADSAKTTDAKHDNAAKSEDGAGAHEPTSTTGAEMKPAK